MSQNDLVIDNQSFPATRSDINSALQALGSLNSGSSAPATTYANMLWYDTTNNTLKMRSEANDQWISVGYLDQSADAFRIFDDTQVVNASGTQTGLIGDQATATWEAGTGTTESLVSPAKVKAAVEALAPERTYNYQEFLTSGTWTKPANAETGDVVYVEIVGGGGGGGVTSGASINGGGGGGGGLFKIQDIDLLGATEAVAVGAGGASRSTTGNGLSGGTSSFGTASTRNYITATGGTSSGGGSATIYTDGTVSIPFTSGGDTNASGENYGGGGGGSSNSNASSDVGGGSLRSGAGGRGRHTGANAGDGIFPGGGGGAATDGGFSPNPGDSGAGADGVVRVWCVKED